MCVSGLSVSIPGLEKSLHQYTLEPSEKPFDMKTVPLATAPITEQKMGTTTGICLFFLVTEKLSRSGIRSLRTILFVRSEIAPVATSKLPEKLAPSRQDIYQGK